MTEASVRVSIEFDPSAQAQAAWDRFVAYLPTLATAVGALVGFYVLARVLRWLAGSALRKTRLDDATDATRLARLLGAIRPGLAPSQAVAQLVFLFVMLIAWMIALDALGVPAIRDMLTALVAFVPNLTSAIVILAIGAFVAAAAGRVVHAFLKEMGSPLAGGLGSLAEILLLVVVVAVALEPIGADTTILTANLTVILGLVAALLVFLLAWSMRRPAEQIIANYYLRRLLAVGDVVEIGGARGEVVGFAPLGVLVKVDDMEQLVPARHVLDGLRRRRTGADRAV